MCFRWLLSPATTLPFSQVDDEPVVPPRSLPWYPNGYAWQLEFSRNQLRKLPLLEDIHKFVVAANDAGSISRQEAVSMVPPLFLDVQPHHRVRAGVWGRGAEGQGG